MHRLHTWCNHQSPAPAPTAHLTSVHCCEGHTCTQAHPHTCVHTCGYTNDARTCTHTHDARICIHTHTHTHTHMKHVHIQQDAHPHLIGNRLHNPSMPLKLNQVRTGSRRRGRKRRRRMGRRRRRRRRMSAESQVTGSKTD